MSMTQAPLAGADDAARYRVLCAGVCALILTMGVARFAYTPLLPIMRHEAGLSYLAGGWLATSNYAGYLAGVLIATVVKDLNVKFLLYRLGLIVAVVSTVAMGWTEDVVLWAVLRLVAGLSSAAGLLMNSGLVLNWLMRNGHKAQLGVHFAGIGLGIAVSGVAVALMVDHLAWHAQWLALGVLGLAFLVPAWWWMPRPMPVHDRQIDEAGPGPSRRWMALFVGSYFCAGFGYVVSATFIVAILEKMPQLSGKGAWLWVVVGLAAVPSTPLWDRVAQRLGYVSALLLGFGLQALATVLPVLTHDPWLNLLSAVLLGGTMVGLVNLTLTLIGRRFPANASAAMARLTISYGIAQVVAPAIAGTMAAASGGYEGALVLAAVIMVAGMAMLWAMMVLGER